MWHCSQKIDLNPTCVLVLKKTGKWENGSSYGHQEVGRCYTSEVNLRDPSQAMKHTSRSIDTGFDARQTVSEVQNRGKGLMSSFLKKILQRPIPFLHFKNIEPYQYFNGL